MTMVEQVARAMLDALKKQSGGSALARGEIDDALLDGQFDLSPVARSAIEAMREPTPEMLATAMVFTEPEVDSWRAMIDAALADEKADERPTHPRTA